LGLSVTAGIMQAHGGRIWAESVPWRGATFFVELPIVAEAVEPVAAPTPPRARPVAGRRILVVDDEPEVLKVLEDLLELDGHQVEVASNGAEALARLSHESYDLILSDIRMPGLNGRDLYRGLEAEQPWLLGRLIFVTGDTVTPDTQALLDETGAAYLTKPFTLEAVRQAIARLLESSGRSA
jgi:two-component system NtrC family sensor kinase